MVICVVSYSIHNYKRITIINYGWSVKYWKKYLFRELDYLCKSQKIALEKEIYVSQVDIIYSCIFIFNDFDPVLVLCWATVFDTGPTLNQH